eukprot:541621_1
MRQIFFAVHLFNQQIFSMSEHLEEIMIQFLKVSLNKCCSESEQSLSEDCDLKMLRDHLCAIAGHKNAVQNEEKMQIHNSSDLARKKRVLSILWNKFKQFRQEPNLKQCIKIDTISDGLKHFFMQEKRQEGNNAISFSKIIKIFPNVKEVRLVNEYKFTERMLHGLIKQIEEEMNQIKKIVFLYYNCNKIFEYK